MKKLIFLLALFQYSCTVPSTDPETVKTEVRETLLAYNNAIRTDGLLSEFKYLDSSASFFWVPPGYDTPIFFDSVASVIRRNAPVLRKVDNSYESLTVVPVNDALASYSGKLRSVVTDTSGHTSTTTLIETGLLIRRESGWKLLCGQTTVKNGN